MNRFRMLPMLLLPLAVAFAAAAEEPAVTKAQEAAQAWLALTDGGQYGRSWEEAAALFKGAVTKAAWESALTSVRSPLGALITRTRKSAALTHTLPGAPDGTYVVFQFETRFGNKAAAVETLTPMLEKDGSWRVSGYYIR